MSKRGENADAGAVRFRRADTEVHDAGVRWRGARVPRRAGGYLAKCPLGTEQHEHGAHGRGTRGRFRAEAAAAYPRRMNEAIAAALLAAAEGDGAGPGDATAGGGTHAENEPKADVDGAGSRTAGASRPTFGQGSRRGALTPPRFASLRNPTPEARERLRRQRVPCNMICNMLRGCTHPKTPTWGHFALRGFLV
eukprot:5649396-Pleurochrysis_carterae.AAC.1